MHPSAFAPAFTARRLGPAFPTAPLCAPRVHSPVTDETSPPPSSLHPTDADLSESGRPPRTRRPEALDAQPTLRPPIALVAPRAARRSRASCRMGPA